MLSTTATKTSDVGSYPIKAEAGSVTNSNVTYVDGTLTITQAPLTVAANSFTITQGDAMPTFDATYSGFKNDETAEVLTKQPRFTCTATSSSKPGTYDIIVSDAEAQNYEIYYTNGTLTIKEADPVKVTANSYTITYGDAIPEFGYTSSGAALSGTPAISCEATSTSPVGTYPIVISKGGVSNYNDSYVNGVLTITKAPLTISVGNYTKKQYDPMPDFDVSYEGFKNNETKDVLTKQPTLSCKANEESTPGEYPIAISGAEATNYQIQYVEGKLIVTEPDSYTLTYIVDGEVYQSFVVKYREAITPLEAPTKEGYTFSGWNGLPRSMPAKDVTVKGTFTVNSYTVTFMYGDEVLYIEEVNYGETIPIPEILDKYGLVYKWLDVPETMPAHDVVILVDETDMIESLTPDPSQGRRELFNLSGQRLSKMQKGINIVGGRKVLVK